MGAAAQRAREGAARRVADAGEGHVQRAERAVGDERVGERHGAGVAQRAVLQLEAAERPVARQRRGERLRDALGEVGAAELQQLERVVRTERRRELLHLLVERRRARQQQPPQRAAALRERRRDRVDARAVEHVAARVELLQRPLAPRQRRAQRREVLGSRRGRRRRRRVGLRVGLGGRGGDDGRGRGVADGQARRGQLGVRGRLLAAVQHELGGVESQRLVGEEAELVGTDALGAAVDVQRAQRRARVDEAVQLLHCPRRAAHAQRAQLVEPPRVAEADRPRDAGAAEAGAVVDHERAQRVARQPTE